MYIIAIAWIYVTVMMAVAEATSSTGTVLGALVTFVLYGMLPVSILVYILSTPARKRAIKAREAAEQTAYEAQQAPQLSASGPLATSSDSALTALNPSVAPDTSCETPGAAESGAVASVRKEL